MSETYKVYQIDSFTKKKFTGNPAGVVYNASGLNENQMQKIARELNNSETAFIINPIDDSHDVWVRFFTPSSEVPICGHATIAAHYVRAKKNNLDNCTVIQKTGAGNLPVEIIKTDNDYQVRMTQGKIEFVEPFHLETKNKILTALGITQSDLEKDCPIQIVSTGHSKVMIGINSVNLLNTLNPDLFSLSAISKEIGCNGFFVFAFNPDKDQSLTKGRMFAPAIGINEDPVTGNANGPLGAYLIKHNLVKHNGSHFEFIGIQGEAMGREGQMNVEVIIKNNLPERIKIKGDATIVFETELTL